MLLRTELEKKNKTNMSKLNPATHPSMLLSQLVMFESVQPYG